MISPSVYLQVPPPAASIPSPKASAGQSWASLVSPVPNEAVDVVVSSCGGQSRRSSPNACIHCHDLTMEKEKWLHSYRQQKEIALRAEQALRQLQLELDDLAASLFSAANQMVARERQTRASLEEKLGQTRQQVDQLQWHLRGSQ
ncbi:hypothetical protein BC940DRAFT_365581 [Gongronella butleri]|nr:hypothetical protein BC940DRAFT_365581 [Gongronella butleri]